MNMQQCRSCRTSSELIPSTANSLLRDTFAIMDTSLSPKTRLLYGNRLPFNKSQSSRNKSVRLFRELAKLIHKLVKVLYIKAVKGSQSSLNKSLIARRNSILIFLFSTAERPAVICSRRVREREASASAVQEDSSEHKHTQALPQCLSRCAQCLHLWVLQGGGA